MPTDKLAFTIFLIGMTVIIALQAIELNHCSKRIVKLENKCQEK